MSLLFDPDPQISIGKIPGEPGFKTRFLGAYQKVLPLAGLRADAARRHQRPPDGLPGRSVRPVIPTLPLTTRVSHFEAPN